MPRFDVVVYRQVTQFIELVVDAADAEDAQVQAEALAKTQAPERWQVETEMNDGAYTFNVSAM